MSSLHSSTPAKLSPAPVSTALANAAVQRVLSVVDTQPEAQDLYRQGPELQRHLEAILQGTYFNDNGFEAVSTYSVDEFAAELRRRPPSRWTGKTAPPLPTQVQAQACPYLRFG